MTTQPYRIDTGRMSEVPSAAPNKEVCVICNSVSYPFILFEDDDANISVTQLSPSANGIEDALYPTFCKIWNDRLFLVYPDGHLRFSVLGSFDFSGDTGLAGEHYYKYSRGSRGCSCSILGKGYKDTEKD